MSPSSTVAWIGLSIFVTRAIPRHAIAPHHWFSFSIDLFSAAMALTGMFTPMISGVAPGFYFAWVF